MITNSMCACKTLREVIRKTKGGLTCHRKACMNCGNLFDRLKYDGMNDAQLALARHLSKAKRLKKARKKQIKADKKASKANWGPNFK